MFSLVATIETNLATTSGYGHKLPLFRGLAVYKNIISYKWIEVNLNTEECPRNFVKPMEQRIRFFGNRL